MKRTTFRFWALAAALALGAAASGEARDSGPEGVETPAGARVEERVWVEIEAADRVARTQAADLGLSIEEVSPGVAAGVATPEALQRLRSAGFTIRSLTRLKDAFPLGFPKPDEAYHDYAEVQAGLAAVAQAHPDLASLIELGRSHKGLSITGLRFNTTAKGAEPSAKPGAFFLGTHHAREHLSTEVPLLAAQWLAENRAKPEVRGLLETRDIYFVPLLNPDGSEYDVEDGDYRWQRKNLSPNADGTVGTDLNRNYDHHWGESGSSRSPGDDTYRGTAPFSEPESKAVRDFVLARPNLKTMVSYHTYSELILYPWSYTDQPLPAGPPLRAYQAMARKMAQWTGYTPQQSSDLYASSGDTCDWAWEAAGIYCFTFELTPRSGSGGGFYPGPAVIAPTVAKNVPAILYLIGLADNPLRAANSSQLSGR